MPFKAADKFHEAICAGDFNLADRLLDDLRREIDLRWSNAAPAERKSISAEAMELLLWARKVLLTRRSHLQRQLAGTVRSGAYVARPGGKRLQIDLEG